MRGTTLNVPSFWMLACTRSLMKRASRSSSYSLPQRVLRSEARPILLGASSRPLASAANTAETLHRPRSLISRIRSGFESGTPGTYQCTDGSSTGASPTQLSKSALTSFLHEPQPVPARVASQSGLSVRFPPRTEARIAPLETPFSKCDVVANPSDDALSSTQ